MTNCSWRIAKSPFEKIIKFYQSKLLRNLNWQNPLFNRHHGHHHRQLAVLRQLRQVRLTQTVFIGMVVETRQSPSRLQEQRRM